MQRVLPSVFFSLFASAGGCATGTGMTSNGFVSEYSAYTVAYSDPGKRRLLPQDWMLENFFQDAAGRPTVMKSEGAYKAYVDWTWPDGSGENINFVTHDLKFLHRASNATIWVRTIPVPTGMVGRRLQVLAESWVDRLNGTVFDFTFSSPVDARRMATKLIESRSTSVAGKPAHDVTFDLVNLDRLELDPQAPHTRIRATFILAHTRKHVRTTRRGHDFGVPAVVFVGYSADAGTFDSDVPVLENLLARIRIPGGQ